MPTEQRTPPDIRTIDLDFLGIPETIAVYLIPHTRGAVLVECGPGSTRQNLTAGLAVHGLQPSDISDVLITHIHLDHAGSAGWWARQGAQIHVHPVGAPHLENPDKLLTSASRIYGDQMDRLWGEFLPVPKEKLTIHEDNEIFEINGLVFKVLDTPGHAFHHFAYIFQNTCFTGDIGAVRVGRIPHLRIPTPPPELNIELWRGSVAKLKKEYTNGAFTRIAPTHFGIFEDAGWHLDNLESQLNQVNDWIEREMPENPTLDEVNERFLNWVEQNAREAGLSSADIQAFEAANPSWMSPAGIYRYWHKVRNPA